MQNKSTESLLMLARDAVELAITRTQMDMAEHVHMPTHLLARLRALSDVRQKLSDLAVNNVVNLSEYVR
jgi:hypothetical protein